MTARELLAACTLMAASFSVCAVLGMALEPGPQIRGTAPTASFSSTGARQAGTEGPRWPRPGLNRTDADRRTRPAEEPGGGP